MVKIVFALAALSLALAATVRADEVQFNNGRAYKLWGSFLGESKLLWVWDSTPAEGKKQVDVAYFLGIGYGF